MDSTAGFVLTGGHRSAGFVSDLLAAEQLGCASLAPQTDSGLRPLGVVHHCCTGYAVEFCLKHKLFKMHDLLKSKATSWPVAKVSLLEHVNTPLEWGAR
jgi:hypothetical protein